MQYSQMITVVGENEDSRVRGRIFNREDGGAYASKSQGIVPCFKRSSRNITIALSAHRGDFNLSRRLEMRHLKSITNFRDTSNNNR